MVNEKTSKNSLWKICTASGLLIVAVNKNAIAGVDIPNLDQVKQGLDIGEHGMAAYAGFQIFSSS